MVDATNGKLINTAGLNLLNLRDAAGIEAELESVQYELTREMTRLLATKASQIQVRIELASPILNLKQAMATFQYVNAGDDFNADMASTLETSPQDSFPSELQAWFARNSGFLGNTPEQQAQWKSLLNAAGFDAPTTKVPVYINMQVIVYDAHNELVSNTQSGELVWMDPGQREALGDTLIPSSAYQVPGVEQLGIIQTENLDGGQVRMVYTNAFCMDEAAGPRLSQDESDQLRDAVQSRAVSVATVLKSDSLQLVIQNANLLNVLDDGVRFVKGMRASRERGHEVALEDDQVRAAQQAVQDRWRDRQNAGSAGQSPVAGSLRSTSFPTTAPDFTDDDPAFRPHQPNI